VTDFRSFDLAVDLLWICCGLCTVRFVFFTDLLTNISTIFATQDDNFDILDACCTIDVASAVSVLHLHIAATVCSSKRVSVTKTDS